MGASATARRSALTFEETVDQAMAILQRRGRVAYHTLKRQFQLDDDALENLAGEIIRVQRRAADENGDVLVWTDGPSRPVRPMGNRQLPHSPIRPLIWQKRSSSLRPLWKASANRSQSCLPTWRARWSRCQIATPRRPVNSSTRSANACWRLCNAMRAR